MKHQQEHPIKPINVYKHLARNLIIAILLIILALFTGMTGYHYFESMPWTDAFLNASMILSGMGFIGTLHTVGGKIFSGFYALFSGIIFIVVIVVMLTPIVHHVFRRIHMENTRS